MVIGTDEQAGLERGVWDALARVRDPEIPPCSITDLGIVESVSVDDEAINVELLPTFAGCPALDVIRQDAEAAVRQLAGVRSVNVRFVFTPSWTSDRITKAGRAALRQHGITPPGQGRPQEPVVIPLASLFPTEGTSCPFCGSSNTVLESAFGTTLCRATHYCRTCRNPFEAFKPKTA